jgi:prolipoprotein diacylglyceryltransferase
MYSHFNFTDWVTPFGLIFIGAIATSWCLARRNAMAINIHGSHIDLLIPLSIMVGVAGGAVLSLAMPRDQMIAGELMRTGVRIRLFGMLATSAVAIFIYSRLAGLSFRRLLDVFAVPTLAGLMIHRLGCFLAGCCWGDIVSSEHATRFASQVQTLPFLSGVSDGVQYPPGSLPYEQHVALGLVEPNALASLPVYPVQLYEGALLLVLLLAFSRFSWRRYEQGVLTVLVICAYAIIRFLIEFLRADGAIVLGNLTVTQLQCLLLLVSAVLLPRMLRPDKRQRLA